MELKLCQMQIGAKDKALEVHLILNNDCLTSILRRRPHHRKET